MASKTSDFYDALKHLMATPGARSDDLIFSSPRRAGKSMAAALWNADNPQEPDLITGTMPDLIWFDDEGVEIMAETNEAARDELVKLADRMTDELRGAELKVQLLAPGMLTVSIPGKGYSKVNHTGGEEFTVDSVYVGSAKAGSRLIFKMKPTSASSYEFMEMNDVEAQTNLDGFRVVADAAAGGNFVNEMKAIRQIDQKAKQAIEVIEKAKEYPEFGSW